MKLSTMHVIVGFGAILSTIAVGVSTKLASDKINEVRQVRQQQDPSFTDLTAWEKFKIGIPYYVPPLIILTGTIFGITECYTGSQEAIKFATDGMLGVTMTANAYRDVIRREIGQKKEEDLYQKLIQQNFPKEIPPSVVLGDGDFLCKVVSPGFNEDKSGPVFVSNATKIMTSTLDFNNFFIRKVKNSVITNAQASVAEWYSFQGVETDNKALDNWGWDYELDGTPNVTFRGDLDNNKPFLGVVFTIQPRYIK